jgi:hypothetical protein
MTQFLAEWMSWWQGYHQEPISWEADGGRVLVVVRHHGIRDGSHFEEVGALVYTVRPDGMITGWTAFASAEEARAWMAASG